MKLAKVRPIGGDETICLVQDAGLAPLDLSGGQYRSLTDLLEAPDPAEAIGLLVDRTAKHLSFDSVQWLPPIDRQEVWAAGVTYKRSKAARMEESVGAASFYDKVYEAARPELFFKAVASRVVGPDRPVRIRKDGKWNVPEPELTLVLSSRLKLVGFTIGNDMSSRDIEGENPLYLPQAKVYDQSCALGPWITLASAMPKPEQIGIRMVIERGGKLVFKGATDIGQLNRTFEDLIEYLGRDCTYRDGVYLLTGTGIVPDASFTLQPDDMIRIAIDGIGTLSNPVVRAG
ncbi:MAG: fumarylacetoacetate hydrolase family protein [Planctomycetes bacterium]|nr:fumarylacetoacetate hydrolase family protein [Planctomycetota bacterium]